jgi:hypothetical protein
MGGPTLFLGGNGIKLLEPGGGGMLLLDYCSGGGGILLLMPFGIGGGGILNLFNIK